jgi:hypothetical protein
VRHRRWHFLFEPYLLLVPLLVAAATLQWGYSVLPAKLITGGWLAIGCLGLAFVVALRRAMAWLVPPDMPRPLTTEKFLRISRVYQSLPDPLPKGWARPYVAPDPDEWRIDVGPIHMRASATIHGPNAELTVRMMKKGRQDIPDAEAKALLATFRDVDPFTECTDLLSRLMGGFAPRIWFARFPEAAALRALPRPTLEPLPRAVLEAKDHLPRESPEGWSPPIAVVPPKDGEEGGWMFDAGGTMVLAYLVTSGVAKELVVRLVRRDVPEADDTDEYEAHKVLKHFRGVSFFRPAPNGKSRGTTYVGAIEPKREEANGLN